MTDRTWFYLDGADPVGPVAEEVVRQLAATGHLFMESFIWTDGLAEWTPLSDVSEFAGSAFAAPDGRAPVAPDQLTRLSLPVGRSGWSIVAGRLGWISLLVVPAPLAMAAGLAAIRDIRLSEVRTGRRLRGTGPALFGLIMGTGFTAILVWIVTVAALG